jgi:WhiB family transcriptional regulator, redox-sensing transcriptional regulator
MTVGPIVGTGPAGAAGCEAPAMTDWAWTAHSACRGMDTEEFFYNDTGTAPIKLERLCKACPVRRECLSHALQYSEFGYWGGTTRAERDRLQRGFYRAACPCCGAPGLSRVDRWQVCRFCGISWAATKRLPQTRENNAAF